jgi:hypothetical protein
MNINEGNGGVNGGSGGEKIQSLESHCVPSVERLQPPGQLAILLGSHKEGNPTIHES